VGPPLGMPPDSTLLSATLSPTHCSHRPPFRFLSGPQLLQYCQFVLNTQRKAKAVHVPMLALASALHNVARNATNDRVSKGLLVACSTFSGLVAKYGDFLLCWGA
jgi:hypothetical protein